MTDTELRERVARALCELQIRNARRFDTPTDELEAKLPAAVEQAWQDFLPQADAALSLMQPEIDRRVAEEKAKLFERFDEDELEQIISNSLDMDWLPRDAAWAIRQAMLAQYEKEQQP